MYKIYAKIFPNLFPPQANTAMHSFIYICTYVHRSMFVYARVLPKKKPLSLWEQIIGIVAVDRVFIALLPPQLQRLTL